MVCAIAVAFSDATSMKVRQSYVVSLVILPTMDCSDVTWLGFGLGFGLG